MLSEVYVSAFFELGMVGGWMQVVVLLRYTEWYKSFVFKSCGKCYSFNTDDQENREHHH